MAKKVLLVEYEPRYLQRLNSVFQSKGWDTEIAKDGEEALAKLQSYAPDLVFISAVLPKVRTAEVIKSLKSNPELKNTKIVLLATGIKEDLIEVEKKKKEVDEILCKPFSETKVIECLQSLEPPQTEPEKKVEEKEGLLDLMPKPEKKLTSEDLFGEFIEEKSEAQQKVEKKDQVDDLLHKTLSSIGVSKAKKTETIPKIDTDIDKKLTETLSGIQLPSKPKKTTQIPKPEEKEIPKKIEEVVVLKTEEKVEEKPLKEIKEEIPVVSEKEERFGNYILIEKLGTGGMAEIYKAKMEGVEGFQKLVAIKKILPQFSHNKDFTTMFIDEAKVAAQLSHRNIVHIYDLGKIENSYFIAMEYMEGTDLRKVIHEAKEKNEKIPIPIALFIASQVASALDYAHNKKDPEGNPLNIVHRDVSPQNILISKDGEIKICDFGIAKAASKASHTRAGSLKGKLQYMSPEQAWGKTVNFKSDIFSLGIVLYEMFTGKHLFEGDSELSILEKARHPKFEPLAKLIKDCPLELENIIEKALKENEDERYPDANSMKKEIDEIISRYEPKVTEKTISEYLSYLEGTKSKFIEFKYKAPIKKEEVEEKPKEKKVEPIKEPIPKKIVEKKPEKEEIPLKPPEIKLPEKKAPYILEEGKTKEKKFPIWAVAAGVAAVLIIVGILFFATGKKSEEIKQPSQVEEIQQPSQVEEIQQPSQVEEIQQPSQVEEIQKTEETPSTPTETTKKEKIQPTKVEPPKEVKEKKEAVVEKEVKEKSKETVIEKKEEAPPQKEETVPEKKEIVEEVKAPEPVLETPPPPPPKVEEIKEPEKKEEVEEKITKYKTGDLVDITTPGLIAPKIIKKATPAYPPIAKMQKIQGRVDVRVLVDENGNVSEAKAISGHNIFHTEAEKASLKSKFAPAQIGGVKVKSYFTISFDFKL